MITASGEVCITVKKLFPEMGPVLHFSKAVSLFVSEALGIEKRNCDPVQRCCFFYLASDLPVFTASLV